jgi:hypothetical protein
MRAKEEIRMVVRVDELEEPTEAIVYRFPVERARSRIRAARRAHRRRRTFLGVVSVFATLAFFLGGGVGYSTPHSATGAPRALTIQPGQTLWDVAERYAPEGMDPRAYVDAVDDLNDLEGPLLAGQRIRLPR